MFSKRGAVLLLILLAGASAARAQGTVPCGPFTRVPPAEPMPRSAAAPVHRFEIINRAVKTQPHRVLFLGDLLTERFETDAPEVWRANMAPRGVLNAGVSGDRTEHLLWRLQHGNLAAPPPALAIVLIGTNDLTNGGNPRPAEIVFLASQQFRSLLPAPCSLLSAPKLDSATVVPDS